MKQRRKNYHCQKATSSAQRCGLVTVTAGVTGTRTYIGERPAAALTHIHEEQWKRRVGERLRGGNAFSERRLRQEKETAGVREGRVG